MKMKAGSTPSELPKEGTYVGRLFSLIDLGSQSSTYGIRRFVRMEFELLDSDMRRSDGQPFTVSRRFTLSLHEKAALRQMLQTWRGKSIVDGEDIEPADFVGQYGMATITIGTSKDGKEYPNLSTVTPLPKSFAKPKPVNKPVVYFINETSDDVLNALPEKLRELIMASPEYVAGPVDPDLDDGPPARSEGAADIVSDTV